MKTVNAWNSAKVLMIVASAALFSGAVLADETTDAGDRIDQRGDRIEDRLDDRGDRMDDRLDNRGDRINDRLDDNGDRSNDRLDRRADRGSREPAR